MSKIRRLNVARSTSAAPHPATALLLLLGAATERRQVAFRQGVQGGRLLVRYVPKIRPPHTLLLGEKRPSQVCDSEGRTGRQEEEDDELKKRKSTRRQEEEDRKTRRQDVKKH